MAVLVGTLTNADGSQSMTINYGDALTWTAKDLPTLQAHGRVFSELAEILGCTIVLAHS